MATKEDKPPTEAEIAAAQAVMQRAQAARAAEADAKLAPLRELTASAAFAEVQAKAEALPLDFMADMNVAPHIMALRAGLNGLATVAPPPAPAADAGTDGGAAA